MGLFHEVNACNACKWVVSHTHHKLQLISEGFWIGKSKPSLGAIIFRNASVLTLSTVGYKYHWKHRDLHPKEAKILHPGNRWQHKWGRFCFEINIKVLMFVSGLKRCQFVVWTKQGIFSVEVTDDPSFMSNVCAKLERSPPLSPLLYNNYTISK